MADVSTTISTTTLTEWIKQFIQKTENVIVDKKHHPTICWLSEIQSFK